MGETATFLLRSLVFYFQLALPFSNMVPPLQGGILAGIEIRQLKLKT